MARHKWKEEVETEYGTKPHKCVKCGIRKYWRGGDYQAWEYFGILAVRQWMEVIIGKHMKHGKRPECVGKEKFNLLAKRTAIPCYV